MAKQMKTKMKGKFLTESRRDNLAHNAKFGNGKQQNENLAAKKEYNGDGMATE